MENSLSIISKSHLSYHGQGSEFDSEAGMGGCPGIWRDPGPGPANPQDWDRDRDSEPPDSRDRDKHLRDSPAAKIPRDKNPAQSRESPTVWAMFSPNFI